MPATPTAFSTTSQWIAWVRNGAVSNRGVASVVFTSAEVGQHRIQIDPGTGFIDAAVTANGVRVATIGNLLLNTAYTFRVRSENAGLSAWRTLAVAVPALPAIPADIAVPTAFAANTAAPARVVLSWTDNASNESNYVIEIRGPEGFFLSFDTYALRGAQDDPAAPVTLPVLDAEVGRALKFATTYVAQIKAQGGKFKTTGFTRIETALSAEITFTTAAAQVVILNLPASEVAWLTVAIAPFTVKIRGTPAAGGFTIASGALPAGLALGASSGIVSGTATVAGLYSANIAVTDGVTTDTAALAFDVRTPALAITVTNAAGPLAETQTFDALVGAAFALTLATRQTGPIAAANVWTLLSGPNWLINTAGVLSGTPTESGTFTALIRATNGTQTDDAAITIRVYGVAISSANNLTAFATAAFSLPITTLPAGAVIAAPGDDLPAGAALASGSLAGAVAIAGVYRFDLAATLGTEGATQTFTLTILALFSFDNEWDMILDQPQLEVITYNGPGLVNQWFLSSAPPGLSIDFATPLTGPSSETRKAKVTGAPTASGIFDAEITAEVTLAGVTTLSRQAVRIIVSGGLFLGWFHDIAARREIQYMARSGAVDGYYFHPTEGLQLVRGDPLTLHVILRDAPIHAAELGLRTIETGLTTLALTVLPTDDFDSNPWIVLGDAVTTLVIGTHTVFTLAITTESDEIENRFKALNESEGADPLSAKLTGTGELTGTLNGVVFTALRFPITIRQDLDRR